ncbi:MAG: DUF4065 domain-containing protein [Alphaproteobacteria bacterium]|nr:DUF4065 domain-containing protein [Alphaproteobacteria bacterium]
MKEAYAPIEIANTLLDKFGKKSGGIDHMKLQKLVYCVHGWRLAYKETSKLAEQPEVWQYGPVFPSMYHELKIYGVSPIEEPVKTSPFEEEAPKVPDNDTDCLNLIEWVWKRYGHLSGMALSEMTHKEGTAWRKVAEERKFRVPKGLSLGDDYVRAEFQRLKEEFQVKA